MSGWQKFFTFAALFNLAAGLMMLFAPGLFYRSLFIDEPITVEMKLYVDLFAVLVLTFAWAYWTVSRDPAAHRNLVMMGIIGKTLVVVVSWYHALAGSGPFNFALLVLADLVFAAFFLRFYLLSGKRAQSG
jgi:hypothetical protein